MKFLMCRPENYNINYEINPWMHIDVKANQALALKQWENLYQTMQSCGAQIELIPHATDWPDMTFTANAGMLYQGKIILAYFKHPERQGETPFFKNWFLKHGFDIVNPTDSTFAFEGAGDALPAGDKLFVGYGFRSDPKFYQHLPIFNQHKLILCKLVDSYFYHLDTCYCPLDDNTGIWYPAAFSNESQELMSQQMQLISVDIDEARQFACNAVVINKQIIIPSDCPKLTKDLVNLGYSVHTCDMSEFIKAGGACKCLTLRLD